MKKLILFIIILSSCSDLKPVEVEYYFDLNTLINNQIKMLTEDKAILEKRAIVNSDSAVTTFKPDSLEWSNELQIFLDADINKPALKGQYVVTDQKDPKSNLKIRSYTTNSKKLAVDWLKVYYLDDISKIKKIEIGITEENSIFNSKKELKMEFDTVKDSFNLMLYSIEGFQKMILKDEVHFSIQGNVKH
jgi:hypothetical protein